MDSLENPGGSKKHQPHPVGAAVRRVPCSYVSDHGGANPGADRSGRRDDAPSTGTGRSPLPSLNLLPII